MRSILEFLDETKQLKPDALVFSSKKDHKYIYLKNNPNLPQNLIKDSKRTNGEMYIKNGRRIYPVVVDMFEHPTIMSGDKDLADIWVVDNLDQAQKQLDLMVRSGAKQFERKIRIF